MTTSPPSTSFPNGSTSERYEEQTLITAIAAALAGAGLFLVSPLERPLPFTWGAAGLLFLLVLEDVRRRRIPNWLTVGGALAGLVVAVGGAGWTGILHAVAGALTAFGLLLVPFAMRGLGAGDVKALMALGFFWGPLGIVGSIPWMLVAGGVIAFLLLAIRGDLMPMLRRWAVTFLAWRATRTWTYAGDGGTDRPGLPFAVAIALGASAYQHWGPLWS